MSVHAAHARRIHDEGIVFDATVPLFTSQTARTITDCLAGGVSVVGATVAGGPLTPESAFGHLRAVHRMLHRHRERVMLVESGADFALAGRAGKLGVTLHFQNGDQFGTDLDGVALFSRMGVRVSQLTYNVRNAIGDGCTEPTDAGLSRFGVRLVREMNRVGMVVDGAHSGRRTTLDAMDAAQAPFVFTHTGCRTLYPHPRNIADDQIVACARTGGVVGIYGMPFFLSATTAPRLDDVVRHIAHAVDLVGADHVGIGLDYAPWTQPFLAPHEWDLLVDGLLEQGLWGPHDLPKGAWSYAPGIETPAGMPALTAALLRHGFDPGEVAGIMGGNFVRVFTQVWDGGAEVTG